MIINEQSLSLLTQAVRANFMTGLERAAPTWKAIAMEVPSSTGENVYPYLRAFGNIRKWVGDRVIQNIAKGDFRIVNERYEETHSISRTVIDDGQYGIYTPVFQQVGQNVAAFPDKFAYSVFKLGGTTICPDGQFFFDVDHPVGKPGAEVSVSNFMGGAGEAWYVVDSSKVFKPVIYQPRKAFDLVSFFDPKDPRVFYQDEYVWGVDGRAGFGFSPFWQLAFKSQQPMDQTNLLATLTAMASQKDDAGEPLDVMGTTVVCGPALGETARALVNKDYLANGESNPLKGRLNVVVSPRL